MNTNNARAMLDWKAAQGCKQSQRDYANILEA